MCQSKLTTAPSLSPVCCKHPVFRFVKLRSYHEHISSCQDDPLSSQTPTLDFEDMGHLDRENDILGRQVLNKLMMQ